MTIKTEFVVSAKDRTGRVFDSIDKRLGGLEKKLNGFSRVTSLLPALAGGVGLKVLSDYTDRMSQLRARISLVTDSTDELNHVQGELFKIAQNTRSPLEAANNLYGRLALGTKDLGLEQSTLLKIVDLTSKSLTIGNATTAEASAATLQFSQALGSGKLAGDEFRSLMETAPALMQSVARGMGLPLGALKKLASESKLTTDVVIAALQNQESEINASFSKIPPTIGGTMQQAKNIFLKRLSEFDVENNLSAKIVTALKVVGDAILLAVDNFKLLGAAIGGLVFVKTIVPLFVALAGKISLASLAVRVFTIDVQAMGVKSTIATTATAGLRGALALIGGPAGVALLAAAGFVTLATREDDTTKATNILSESTEKLNELLGDSITANSDAAESQFKLQIAHYNSAKAALVNAEAQLKAAKFADSLPKSQGGLVVDIDARTEAIDRLKNKIEEGESSLRNYTAANGLMTISITESSNVSKQFNNTLDKTKKKLNETEKEAKKFAKELNDLLNELNPARGEAQDFANDLGVLQRAIKETGDPTGELSEAVDKLYDSFQKISPELQNTYDKYFPLQAATKAYHDELKKIDDLYASGLISEQEAYNEAITKAGKEFEKTKKEIEEASEELGLFGKASETAMTAFSDGLVDIIAGVKSAGDVFESWKDSVIGYFKDIAIQGIDFLLKKLLGLKQSAGNIFADLFGNNSGGGGLGGLIGIGKDIISIFNKVDTASQITASGLTVAAQAAEEAKIGLDAFGGAGADVAGASKGLTGALDGTSGSLIGLGLAALGTKNKTAAQASQALKAYKTIKKLKTAYDAATGASVANAAATSTVTTSTAAASSSFSSAAAAAGPYALAIAAIFTAIKSSQGRSKFQIFSKELNEVSEGFKNGTSAAYELANGVEAAANEMIPRETFFTGKHVEALETFFNRFEDLKTIVFDINGQPILRVSDEAERGVEHLNQLIIDAGINFDSMAALAGIAAQRTAAFWRGEVPPAFQDMATAAGFSAQEIETYFDNATDEIATGMLQGMSSAGKSIQGLGAVTQVTTNNIRRDFETTGGNIENAIVSASGKATSSFGSLAGSAASSAGKVSAAYSQSASTIESTISKALGTAASNMDSFTESSISSIGATTTAALGLGEAIAGIEGKTVEIVTVHRTEGGSGSGSTPSQSSGISSSSGGGSSSGGNATTLNNELLALEMRANTNQLKEIQQENIKNNKREAAQAQKEYLRNYVQSKQAA